jgi:hypothetical protein
MRRIGWLCILALLLFPFRVLPQEEPTTGNIEGIVVRAETEEPIANAQVTLTPIVPMSGTGATSVACGTVIRNDRTSRAVDGNSGPIPQVATGANGKFAFKDVKPGTYCVAATANGFVRQEYGQRALYGSGRLLFVVAGQPINDANIRMIPTGTISGRILDERGQPATGAPVQLLRASYNLQGKTFQSVGAASVDDRGNYRIFGVTPGRYTLVAGTMPPVSIDGGVAGGSRFSVVYYPGVSNLDEATQIEVKSGGESSLDLLLKREPMTFHIRGRVINADSVPNPEKMVMYLGYKTFSLSGVVSRLKSYDPVTHTFDISNVPPGELTVNVVQNDQLFLGGMGLAASSPIKVTDADIDGLVLTLTNGVTVQGKLFVEGQSISTVPNLGQLRLNILSIVPPALTAVPPTSSAITADGSFQVTRLREGEYRAQMNVSIPGFYVKSIKYGRNEILGKTFRISDDSSGSIEVLLKSGEATVAGKVIDSNLQPVSGITVV